MSLNSGTRLGPYEIGAPLGAGGMGEVYRARDTRLGRDVAVKVLPEALAADSDALLRFEAEARAVATLSHPHILAIHDFGREDGITYAVMELLDGVTLRQKLAEGPLPLRKATDLARDVAQGLAAAHEKGIVHRDLKPENLFVTKGGRVKILDFGLARQVAAAPLTTDTKSPTMAHRTEPGTVLGTVGYMSPEQVKGQVADARSDIFSFGAVLYEVLTGRRAFDKATAVETMTAILREDPPEPSSSGAHIPPALDRIVRHCLEKEPDDRFRSAHDLAFALEAVSGSSASAQPESVSSPARRPAPVRWPALAGVAILSAVAGAALHRGFQPSEPARSFVSVKPLTHSGSDYDPAVSPDGRTVAFSSTRDGTSRIWLKQLAAGDEVALSAGPDVTPRFSPDGTQIVFARGPSVHRLTGYWETKTDLYRMPILGGAARRIVALAEDADWSPDGKTIAYVRMQTVSSKMRSSLLVVAPEGGEPKELAHWEGRGVAGPRFSLDGRTIVVVSSPTIGSTAASVRYELVGLEGSPPRVLEAPPSFGSSSGAAWDATGRNITYVQGLLATYGASRLVRQDVKDGKSTALLWLPFESMVLDSIPDGRLVADSRSSRQNLIEYALDDPAASPRWLTRGTSHDRQPALSADGERVIFSSDRSGNLDIWELTRKTGALRRLTEHEADDWDPGFTKDGRLLFSSGRSGHLEIWTAEADGGSPRRVSDDGTDAENPTMTPDGWVIYASTSAQKAGLWRVRPDGSGASRLGDCYSLPDTSPDGRYVGCSDGNAGPARFYRLADGARLPLVIDTTPLRATEVQMGRVRWSPDGKRFYFTAQDEKGWTGVFEQAFDPEQKDTTATRRKVAGFDPGFETESFGISPDGKRIVVAALERTYGIVVIDGVGDPADAKAARR